MENRVIFRIVLCSLLFAKILSAPVSSSVAEDFCAGENVYNFEQGKEYLFDYETNTALWINDVSDEAKSSFALRATVAIQRTAAPCTYVLTVRQAQFSGDSIDGAQSGSIANELNSRRAVFRLGSRGQLDAENIEFEQGDQHWARNVRRGIISAFQTTSLDVLRPANLLDSESGMKSAVVYETDILGRCRTIYHLHENNQGAYMLHKTKSLQRCTLNNNRKSSALQYIPYTSIAEYEEGQLFVESYKCSVNINDRVLREVKCDETSTYARGARGNKGAQAVVSQKLSFRSSSAASTSAPSSVETRSINFEFDERQQSELENANFNANQFTSQLCEQATTRGLVADHAAQFRDLAISIRSLSKTELLKLYDENVARCELAGVTVAQALLFADTEAAFDAVLALLDRDAFSSQRLISEYPVLTALARYQYPSVALINRFRDYVRGKPVSFPYLNKLNLAYSALVRKYCRHNECATSQLNEWSSIFEANLANACGDESHRDLVVSSLKAVGNIGQFANTGLLEACAARRENSLEVRVSAIQSLRRFSCDSIESLEQNYKLLGDYSEDTEVRITAFQTLMRCSDDSARFARFVRDELESLFLNEQDTQVLSYIVDYAKERSLTSILNVVLNEPRIRERFSVNFKEISWNNFRYRYDFVRDGACEVDASVIYTPKTFIPRSVRFNVTLHAFGMSINFLDATLRLEGMDNVLKAFVVDRLRSEALLRKISENPANLLEILQIVASKLQYVGEKPFLSLALRVYGSEVFHSQLDTAEEFQRLASILRNPRETLLYGQVLAIRNMFLVDSRVKHPLMNGLEFNSLTDASLSILFRKSQSTKETADAQTGQFNYKINNVLSESLAVNKRFEVHLNNVNRLALKKRSNFHVNLVLNVDGFKQPGAAAQYNFQLPQADSTPIITMDGRFYKLGKNNQYSEVREFKTSRFEMSDCLDKRFKAVTGISLCLSASRPSLALKSLPLAADFSQNRQNNDESNNDDNNDDEDDQNESLAPMILLRGPFHYEATLKNPDRVKSVRVTAGILREKSSTQANISFETVSANGEVVKRIELAYQRERQVSNIGVERRLSLEVRRSSSQEVLVRLGANFAYERQSLLHINFTLDNNLKESELHANVEFRRQKNKDSLVPTYHIHAQLDTPISHHSAHFHLKNEGKDITSHLLIERQSPLNGNQLQKLVVAELDLIGNDDSTAVVDYQVKLNAESARGGKVQINGQTLLGIFKSNFDLTVDYTLQGRPVIPKSNILLGHKFDASNGLRGELRAGFNVFNSNLNLVELKVAVNPEKRSLELLEIKLTQPHRQQPLTISFEKISNDDSLEYTLSLTNSLLDLSQSTSTLAGRLTKVDDSPLLKSLVFHLTRVRNAESKRIDYTISARKNDKQFVRVEAAAFGDLRAIRESSTELAKQSLGVELYIKVNDNSGRFNAKLGLESSKSRSVHDFSFELKTENLFKMITRVGLIESKFNIQNNQVNAKYRVERLGEVRSFQFQANNAAMRPSADGSAEFDISYEKTLSSGKVLKANGVARFKYTDFKNFESSVTVKDHYEGRVSVETRRTDPSAVIGYHDLRLNLKHLDADKSERDLRFFVHNETSSLPAPLTRRTTVTFLSRRGEVGTLENRATLAYLIDVQRKYSFVGDNLVNSQGEIEIKSKRFNIECKASTQYSVDASRVLRASASSQLKFPAIFTDPGKINFLNEKGDFVYNPAERALTLNYELDTNSKLFGRLVKQLNLNVQRTVSETGFIDSKWTANYKPAVDDASEPPRKVFVRFERQPLRSIRVTIQQNRLPKINMLEVSDCVIEGKFERVKVPGNYLLDTLLNVNCNGKAVTENSLRVSRKTVAERQNTPSTRFALATRSQVFYPGFSVQVAHDKFIASSGLAELNVTRGEDRVFAEKFSYTRVVNPVSRSLDTARYTLTATIAPINSLIIGNSVHKSCEFNIDARSDYYNSFMCEMRGDELPGKQIAYGYKLKVDNPRERLFGRRGGQLDIIVPGRTVRAIYRANHATPIDGTDDDNDENDEREFNSTLTFYPNAVKEPQRHLIFNAKRDNYAKGKAKFYVEMLNHRELKSLRFDIDRSREINQTQIKTAFSYELKDGRSNRLELTTKLSSDLDTNSLSSEVSLQRPAFNVLYENRHNKHNGRLSYLSIRLGRLVRLTIDKEYDPKRRQISLALQNPDEARYSLDIITQPARNQLHVVEATLNEAGKKLTTSRSSFNAATNQFDITVDCIQARNTYNFNFGLYDETRANSRISDTRNGDLLVSSLSINKQFAGLRQLELEVHWKRFWSTLQRDILGGESASNLASPSSKFNSHFGDVYAELSQDLKTAVDVTREERQAILKDFKNLLLVQIEFYSKFLGRITRNEINLRELLPPPTPEDDSPLAERLVRRYKTIAQVLNSIALAAQARSSRLGALFPRLPDFTYNANSSQFPNNLVITRLLRRAKNLYQVNAEYRDMARRFGERLALIKAFQLRNLQGANLRALINKYKYRSLRDYTLVGHVYNRRNIIGFDGDSKVLQSRCRYLLAHELSRNAFSIVLNFNDNQQPISVFVEGREQSIDISATRASYAGKAISLPAQISIAERQVSVRRSENGVCAELENEFEVCCYEDSNSCTVATSRWYTGRLNGLLGRADLNADKIQEADWYLEKTCKFPNAQPKRPSEEAVRACYALFGKHRSSPFRTALQTVRPDGWQRICESVLTADSKAKCAIQRAFVHHAGVESVSVNVPNDCFTCALNEKKYVAGQVVEAADQNVPATSAVDIVFVLLPCDESRYSLDFAAMNKIRANNPLARLHVVRVEEDDASIQQSDSNEQFNINFDSLSTQIPASNSTSRRGFYKGLYLAVNIFSRRLAASRHLVLRSCGNCQPYSLIDTLKGYRILEDRNIAVHAWGDYSMRNSDSDEEELDVPFGYDSENVFLLQDDGNLEAGDVDSYSLKHAGDMCTRFAQKTEGTVLDINQLRSNAGLFSKVLGQFEKKGKESLTSLNLQIQRCERVDTPFGDFADFDYTRRI